VFAHGLDDIYDEGDARLNPELRSLQANRILNLLILVRAVILATAGNDTSYDDTRLVPDNPNRD